MVGLFTINGPLNNQITLIIECNEDGQAAQLHALDSTGLG